jgi:uncharacterized protein YkwD
MPARGSRWRRLVRHRLVPHGPGPHGPGPHGRARHPEATHTIGQLLGLAVILVLPAMAAGGCYAGGGAGDPPAQTTAAAGPPSASTACARSADSAPCAPRPAVATSAASPRASATHSLPPKATQATAAPTKAAVPVPAASPAPASNQQGTPADQVLAVINQARATAGLPAYVITSGLDLSATRHNTVMAGGCGLSHRCPGEAALGARETAAGVTWTSAGENIGEGGPVSASTAAISQMAVALTRDMLAEKPPDDGHRLNILSSAFHHVGIAVYRSSSGTVWMTQDFSN